MQDSWLLSLRLFFRIGDKFKRLKMDFSLSYLDLRVVTVGCDLSTVLLLCSVFSNALHTAMDSFSYQN